MSRISLYDHDEAVTGLGIDVPAWIEQDITAATVAAILEGGCASGSYMPAVTYHDAEETMHNHGDAVLQYLEDSMSELPAVPRGESWCGIAVFFLSCAVETWCSGIEEEIKDKISERDDETEVQS